MAVQALSCPNCSASLDVDDQVRRTRCSYCGTSLRVQGGAGVGITLIKAPKVNGGAMGVILLVPTVIGLVWFFTSQEGDPELAFQMVEAQRVERDHPSASTQLVVGVHVELKSDSGHMSPHVIVKADCNGKLSEEKLFFMELSNLGAGSVRNDAAELFFVAGMPDPKATCQLTLTTKGAVPLSETYCSRPDQPVTKGTCM